MNKPQEQIVERRNIERRAFVGAFVAQQAKAGTWPDSDIKRMVMLNELIEAWENRAK